MTETVDSGLDSLDSEILTEFIEDFRETYRDVEIVLLKIEKDAHNQELLHNIYRHIHTVKGNLQVIDLDVLAEFVHSLESILDRIRRQELTFDSLLSDVILLSMDRVLEVCNAAVTGDSHPAFSPEEVKIVLHHIANGNQRDMSVLIARAIAYLDPNYTPKSEIKSPPSILTHDQLHKSDIEFFARTARFLESRSEFWQGRTKRVLEVATDMNKEANSPIDSTQLEAAVYMHDVGMAFLSLELLHKTTRFTSEERRELQSHPNLAALLLARINGWQLAEEIVLQHHEHEDGSGYPRGLMGEKICEGAKILAIADAFEAMTHERASREYKRHMIRALSELNLCAGTQFCQKWVKVLNSVVRKNSFSRSDIQGIMKIT